MSDDENPLPYSFLTRGIINCNPVEVEKHHESCCNNGDGWSHAFDVKYYDCDVKPTASINDGNRAVSCIEPSMAHRKRLIVKNLFTIDNWRRMGDDIKASSRLKHIDLSNCGLDEEDIIAVLGGECAVSCKSLEWFNFHGNSFCSADSLSVLRTFLTSRSSKLQYLNLKNASLGDEGAGLVSEYLEDRYIKHLHLCQNAIGDNGVERLLSARNSAKLERLYLTGTGFHVGRRGFQAISHFLQRDDIELRTLFLSCPDGECASWLIDSISGSSKLETFSFREYDEEFDASSEQEAMVVWSLQNLVCNTSSFDNLCNSNHNLRWVGKTAQSLLKSNPTIESAFDINARSKYGVSLPRRLRCKLRTFYFNREFDVQPFALIDAKLMPYVLELVTRSEICIGKEKKLSRQGMPPTLRRGGGHRREQLSLLVDRLGSGKYYEVRNDCLGGVYRLIRNCHLPELFSFPSPELKEREIEVANKKIKDLEAELSALKVEYALQKQKIEELSWQGLSVESKSSSAPNKRTKASQD